MSNDYIFSYEVDYDNQIITNKIYDIHNPDSPLEIYSEEVDTDNIFTNVFFLYDRYYFFLSDGSLYFTQIDDLHNLVFSEIQYEHPEDSFLYYVTSQNNYIYSVFLNSNQTKVEVYTFYSPDSISYVDNIETFDYYTVPEIFLENDDIFICYTSDYDSYNLNKYSFDVGHYTYVSSNTFPSLIRGVFVLNENNILFDNNDVFLINSDLEILDTIYQKESFMYITDVIRNRYLLVCENDVTHDLIGQYIYDSDQMDWIYETGGYRQFMLARDGRNEYLFRSGYNIKRVKCEEGVATESEVSFLYPPIEADIFDNKAVILIYTDNEYRVQLYQINNDESELLSEFTPDYPICTNFFVDVNHIVTIEDLYNYHCYKINSDYSFFSCIIF